MTNLLTPRRTLAASLLLSGFASAGAQTLGAPQATEAWIGRPLQLQVPVRLDEREARDECVQADVHYGETRVRSGNVRATLSGSGAQQRVRVETTVPIDEPMVTVAVRAGCAHSITRNYTLLTEPLPYNLAAVAQASGAGPAAVAAAPPKPARAQLVANAAPAAPTAPAAPAKRTRAQRPIAAAAPVARLQLDLWQPEPSPFLRVSGQLSQPTQDAARRAAAAMLWKALNADPQEMLRTTTMLHKLEADVAQLRANSSAARGELARLRQQLDAPVPAPRARDAWQAAAVLALIAGALGGFLWWRRRPVAPRSAGGHWYEPAGPVAVEPAMARAAASVAPADMPSPAPVLEPLPVIGPAVPAVRPAAVEPAAARRTPRALPHPALRVETLAASLREVEFLCSLGMWGDAMDVLKAYLQDSDAPAPLGFHELMRICVETDDAAGLAAVRRRYTHTFGVEPPAFDQLVADDGLDDHEAFMRRVQAVWGTPRVLGLIEQRLFSAAPEDEPLSLRAAHDLMELHTLARATVRETGASAGIAEPAGSPLAPWAGAEDADAVQAAAQAGGDVSEAHRFAIDIDLDAAPAPLPVSVAEPRVQPQRPPAPARRGAPRGATAAAALENSSSDDALFDAVMAVEGRRALVR